MRLRVCALIVGCASLGLQRLVCAADAPVDDGLLEFLGTVDSEDKAWQEYLAGTDIDSCERVVFGADGFEDVPISRAVAASCAVPMVYKPVEIKDRVYVDGDNVESTEWKPYVNFHGYPTFALLTPDLKEVARYGGENRVHDFEAWVAGLPEQDQAQAKSFFTVIRWQDAGAGGPRSLLAVPYSQAYQDNLPRAANLLKEAAELTDNDSLKRFLRSRAV